MTSDHTASVPTASVQDASPTGAQPGSGQPGATPFVVNDYATITAPSELEPLYQDTYRGFGWDVERAESGGPARALLPGVGAGSVVLRMKRPRDIRNRQLVQELQRKGEAALGRIVRLEQSAGSYALSTAIGFGILGAAVLAGSVFSMESGVSVLSIALGTVGLLLWLAGFVGHGVVKQRRTRAVVPLVDRERSILADAVTQADHLLR